MMRDVAIVGAVAAWVLAAVLLVLVLEELVSYGLAGLA